MMPSSAIGWAASLGAAFTWSFSVMMYRKWGVGRSATWLNLFKGTVALVFFGAAAAISGGFGIISMNLTYQFGLECLKKTLHLLT